jgi:FtsH-binding integral membrane protein
MKEIFEEYGEFVIEAVSGGLFLGILAYFFLGSPMTTLLYSFITSVLGGGA